MLRVAWIVFVEKSGFQKNFEKFWLRKFSVRVILYTYLFDTRCNPFDRARGRPAGVHASRARGVYNV